LKKDKSMKMVRKIRSLFGREKLDSEMDVEMRAHVELQTERNVAAGMDAEEARYAAQRQFGNVASIQQRAREARGWTWLEQFAQDLSYAVRQLRKSPGFTLVAVLTLALGVGATTAIFSGVDAVMLRSLPYPQADRLVHVYETTPRGGMNTVAGNSFIDWRDHQTQFEALFIYAPKPMDLTGMGEPEKIHGVSVSSQFADVLGVRPLLGRALTTEDDAVGGRNNVVMLTEGFWRAKFGAAPDAVGRMLDLDGIPHEIIGVLPRGIWYQRDAQVFVPFVLIPNTYLTNFEVHMSQVFGRLKPDATLASALAELRANKVNLNVNYPEWMHTWDIGAQPLQHMLASDSRPFLFMLLGATSLVLLIACANVANLLLARSAARQREIALRAALGASSARIVRQVLTESVLLACIGGSAGLMMAVVGIRALAVASTNLLPANTVPQLDWRVLGFALGTSLLTGFFFGIFPALRARRPDLNATLKSGNTGATDGGRSRSQRTLVIAEIALTAVLLIATGLLVRGMVRTVTADPGIKPENLLMFELTPPYTGNYGPEKSRGEFLNQVRNELHSVPGVISATSVDDLPFGGGGQGYAVSLEEKPETRQDRSASIKYVSADYFATLGARILRGRPIIEADNRPDAPPVMVINESMARMFFGPDENPLGRLIHANSRIWEVVGVVADLRIERLHLPPRPTFFVGQVHFPWTSGYIVRTQGDPTALAAAVTAAVHRLDSKLPLAKMGTVEAAMTEALGPQRLTLQLIGVFATVALLLAAIGLYGVMAFAVANRRRELSIRVALGAARADIMQLILRDGGRLLLIGLGIGLLAGIGAAKFAASLMAEVRAADPLVFVIAALVLGLVAFVACWLPSRRATKVDPIAALRSE
jgi:predicted permease